MHLSALSTALTLTSAFALFGATAMPPAKADPPKVAAAPPAPPEPAKPEIALELSTVKVTLKIRRAEPTGIAVVDSPVFAVHLVNKGKVAVTLVKPGDGSECGWRTPVVTWAIAPAPRKVGLARCGNMNPLKVNEIFELKPGERIKLDEWVGGPSLSAAAGKYRVTVRYRNDPKMDWAKGLANHDPAAVKLAQASTPLDVESNAVEVVIEE